MSVGYSLRENEVVYSLRENGAALIFIALLFWAGNMVAGRATVGLVAPVTLACMRWSIAGVIALFLARRHLKRDWPAIRAGWRPLVLLSLTGISGYNTLVYLGLQSTTAINGFLINTTLASVVALMCFLLFRDRLGRRAALGLVVAMSGVVWVILGGDLTKLLSLTLNRGDLIVFAGVVCYALYTALLRKRPDIHPMTFIAVTFILGFLFLLPFWVLEAATGMTAVWDDPRTWSVIGYLAIFPSLVSFLCFNRGVALIGANRASALLLMMPLVGVVLSMIFLGEALILAHVVGGMLIFAGLYIGRRKPA